MYDKELEDYIVSYIKDLQFNESINTMCNRISTQKGVTFNKVRDKIKWLEYEGILVFTDSKYNGCYYKTVKLTDRGLETNDERRRLSTIIESI